MTTPGTELEQAGRAQILGFSRSESLAKLAVAKAQAQMKFLPLGKDKSATVNMKAGGSYSYAYADLASCLESVIAGLSESGIALFQPVRVEDGFAIATTLLVHGGSGEWISSDYASPVVDKQDARSVGSAATYARRYGLLAMLAIASTDEDDDGEGARGGAHEMAQAKSDPACPVCGVTAIIKGREEYGGGWLCFKKKGGCGTKWPEGPVPTSAPVEEVMMPRRLPTSLERTGIDPRQAAQAQGVLTPAPSPPTAPVPAQAPQSDLTPDGGSDGPQTFTIGPGHHSTKGCTREQMVKLFSLCPQVNRKVAKGHDKVLLFRDYGIETRDELTRAQADKYIQTLEALLA